jgi:hypothetical protein
MPRNPHERPAKADNIDRREQQKQEQLRSLRPVKNSQIHKLDKVGLKKGRSLTGIAALAESGISAFGFPARGEEPRAAHCDSKASPHEA